MGLLDDLTPPKREWPCAVRTLLGTLDAKDADILSKAVMDPAWQYYTLEQALLAKGITLSQPSIKRHRLKGCSCWRDRA